MNQHETVAPKGPQQGGYVTAGVVAAARGTVFAGLELAGLGVLVLALSSLVAPWIGVAFAVYGPSWEGRTARVMLTCSMIGVLVTVVPFLLWALLRLLRNLTNLNRRLSGEWCGVPIAEPYRPSPARLTGYGRLTWLLTDRATWRDLGWVIANAVASMILAAGPAILIVVGLLSVFRPANGPVSDHGPRDIVLGVLCLGAGVLAAPWLLRGYGLFARTLLAPTGTAELEQRVQYLSQTRTESLDTGAAEIRRIERDLHDGAQARLVAMGMTLDAAGHLIDEDPRAARALLIEARDSSAKALAELRALVRGILPPVLADRGLADAIKALAMDSLLRTDLVSDLRGRPPAPVESAAYFAVSELLANVSKHAQARQAWVDIRYSGQMLRIGVTDNGQGGADPALGTGLQGIDRRLAAFDGVLAISSPVGGPTAVTMEIPCALSLPKTSSC
jgi:signal transduction histidine kinase